MVCYVYPLDMTVIPRNVKREHGEYRELVDVKRVNGKVVQKYAGYLGKSLNSRNEIEPEEILKYVSRLLKKGISPEYRKIVFGNADIGSVFQKYREPFRECGMTKKTTPQLVDKGKDMILAGNIRKHHIKRITGK